MRGCCELRVFRLPCDRMDSCVLVLAGDHNFRRRPKPKQAGFEIEDRPLQLLAKRPLPWGYHGSRRLSGAGSFTTPQFRRQMEAIQNEDDTRSTGVS